MTMVRRTHGGAKAADQANGHALEEYVTRLETEIAQLKGAEAALRKSEERYRLLWHTTTDVVLLINADDRIQYANPATVDVFGYQHAELVGMDLTDLMPPELREPHRRGIQRFLQTGEKTVNWRGRHTTALHRDGHRFAIEISYSVMLVGGEPLFAGFIRDVSERERTAAELRESELRFRQLTENIKEVFWLTDPEKSRMLYVSPTYEDIWGQSRQSLYEAPGHWLDAIHVEDRPRVLEAATTQQVSGGYDEEYRIVRPDGEIRWIRDRAFPVLDKQGVVYRIAGVAEDVTELKQAAERLSESELRFRQLAESIKEVFWLSDPHVTEILYVSPGYDHIWGRSRDRLYESPLEWIEAIHPEDRQRVLEAVKTKHASGDYDEEYRIVQPDGAVRWIRDRAAPVLNSMGVPYRMAGVAEDVTERHLAEQKLDRLNRVYAVLSAINSLIVRTTDRQALLDETCRIAVAHGRFTAAWIGMAEPGGDYFIPAASNGIDLEAIGRIPVSDKNPEASPRGTSNRASREPETVICNDLRAAPHIGVLGGEALKHGCRSVAAFPLRHDDARGGVLVLYSQEPHFFDGDEIKLLDEVAGDVSFGLQYLEKERRLNHLAYYDALTGLPNLTLFQDRLTQFLGRAKRKRGVVAVFLLDLDRFTQINDTLGRHTGDILLSQVAERLRHALWEPFSLARSGSDSYAVAIPELHSGTEAAAIVHEKLFACLDPLFMVDGKEVRVTARAGIALYPGDGKDAETLFKNAEAALRQAQGSGERYLYYAPEINASVARRLEIEAKLRRAIDRGEFLLHYQPKVDPNRKLTGLEALLRWDDPNTGIVPPASFIPALEDSRLILEVGYWVIERALADYREWRSRGLRPPRIAVNVSPLQLRRPEFVARVREVVEASDVGAEALELEVTESVIMEDVESNIRTLREIRDMGVTVAIDDFGTGYASFRYMAKLPVDTIKIDRSFIAAMMDDADGMSIVSTMISLAHSMKFSVVAEGVETEDQARFLRLLRCDELQGYLFSVPLPREEVAVAIDSGGL